MRIDQISRIDDRCTGCLACVDSCPVGCIGKIEKDDGFVYTSVDTERCVNCGRCFSVCPLENKEKGKEEQHLYAAYAKDKDVRYRGSSGGVFELLARTLLRIGYYVCGVAFENNTLKHRIIHSEDELLPLLKSKYIQSDTEGIYAEVAELLKGGERVFFCGTPCQASALVNLVSPKYRERLLVADIICHGVPSQRTFDMYVSDIEKRRGGSVDGFTFRVKDNAYKHAHGYAYTLTRKGKKRTVNGIYTDSSYYNAFKSYSILRSGCYECEYATLERVSDITLADFWGIEKYDFDADTDAGVSMVITNTARGGELFNQISDLVVGREFPVQYGVDSNHCLTHPTKRPKNRDAVIKALANEDYGSVAKRYFRPSLKRRLSWLVPPCVRNLLRKIRR